MSLRSLVDLLAQGADRVGSEAIAVCAGEHGETLLRYGELYQGARSIAGALTDSGLGSGDRIGVWMGKTPATVQAILGILLSGAAYVPLDPRSPWRRCRSIALDCELSALFIDGAHRPMLSDFLSGWAPRLVIVDADSIAAESPPAGGSRAPRYATLEEVSRCPAPATLPSPRPDDLAYVLYTSGSTGQPKGVVHTHRSGLAFARWIIDRFTIRRDDVFSSHAPFHFDLSICDLYAALGTGARVHLISEVEAMLAPYLVRRIPEWGITVWYSVPSILIAMLEAGGLEEVGMGNVRTLFFAGEVFPTPQLRRLRRALPGVGLYNLFGPTETNVCTYYEVPATIPDEWTAPIPIGRACEHMDTFVIDDEGHEALEGVEGTLWARGDNLMSGYWNDATRTADSLRPDPRGRPGLAYSTGDRVKLARDGNYVFLGRRDHMIKTRGFRVELGEIESALASHPAVLEAVAVALPDPKIGNRIVASVVPRLGAGPSQADLRSFCAQRLPAYMVPERIALLVSFPRTSTGKADRQALLSAWREKDGT